MILRSVDREAFLHHLWLRWQFFHVDAETIIHPLSWYIISTSVWWYLCSCIHIISMLCSTADVVVSSVCCPLLFKVLTLHFTICIVLLHLRNFVWVLLLIFQTMGPELQPLQNALHFYQLEGRCSLDTGFPWDSWWYFDGCILNLISLHQP